MSVGAGKNFLLKVEDSAGAGTYTTLGGLQTTTLTMAAEAIDSTTHGSNQNKEVLDGAGIKSMSISGSGLYESGATLTNVETAALDQTLTRFQVIDSSSGGRTYTGLFKITSVERGGGYNDAQAFSISLESSGSITVS